MHTTLEVIFGSPARAKLLGWFFSNPGESGSARQLADLLQVEMAAISREVTGLEEVGILKATRQGNATLYHANPCCAFYQELKGLVLKTTGVAGQIRGVLTSLPGVSHAFIYGPYARGEERAGSDVDLMIVGNIDVERLDELMAGMEKGLGRDINYVVYEPREFAAKREAKNGFIMDVLHGPQITLVEERESFPGEGHINIPVK